MKKIPSAVLVVLALALQGCAFPVQAQPAPATPLAAKVAAAGWKVENTPLAKFTHEDLQAAAAYANRPGPDGKTPLYPLRAQMYLAKDALLTGCEQAVDAAIPALPPKGSVVGFFTAKEIADEALGSAAPAAVLIACKDVAF